MERPEIYDYSKVETFGWEYVFKLNRYIEHLQRRIEIHDLQATNKNKATLCGCIDSCSSKRKKYYCFATRSCIHKIKD